MYLNNSLQITVSSIKLMPKVMSKFLKKMYSTKLKYVRVLDLLSRCSLDVSGTILGQVPRCLLHFVTAFFLVVLKRECAKIGTFLGANVAEEYFSVVKDRVC